MKSLTSKVYAFYLGVTVIAVTEILLRVFGYQPGIFKQIEGFQKVDSLVVYKNYVTDENGIYKFSKWVSDSLPKYYNPAWERIENDEVRAALYPVDNLDYVIKSFRRITNPDSFKSPLWKIKGLFNKEDWKSLTQAKYSETLKNTDDSADEWYAAVKKYLYHPFNSEGFRSIEFKTHKTHRKRILIIGDSFVYGMTAQPTYNSFYDILLAKGYMVYAAGIPGTDPAQYSAIAQKYVPALRPDLVIVCFYPGNDIMNYARIPRQSEPHEHITNAGFYSSNIKGRYYNAQEAYQYYLSLISIPDDGSLSGYFFSKSCIGTLIWNGLLKLNFLQNTVVDIPPLTTSIPEPDRIRVTQQYIDSIRYSCNRHSIPVCFSIIPDDSPPHDRACTFLSCDTLMMNSIINHPYFYPDSFLPQKHFPKKDYHFNNEGHVLFASFLEKLILQADSFFKKSH